MATVIALILAAVIFAVLCYSGERYHLFKTIDGWEEFVGSFKSLGEVLDYTNQHMDEDFYVMDTKTGTRIGI